MRRAGGVFVAGFFAIGAVQALTNVLPSEPSVADARPEMVAHKSPDDLGKFTGTGAPVRKGSVPASLEGLINRWGNRCETLTPALLAAQLFQESGFSTRRGLRSSAGAQGIAQFIPATWATHGLDGDGDGDRDVWDPKDAIPSAAHYDCAVARQVRKVPGDPIKNMLAGYNAGPHRVTQYQGVPPYRETQGYVRNILKLAGERFERR